MTVAIRNAGYIGSMSNNRFINVPEIVENTETGVIGAMDNNDVVVSPKSASWKRRMGDLLMTTAIGSVFRALVG
ncbi:MAG: hypothetical protein ACKVPY_01205 [Paracoccaceae bacterium]